MDFVTQKLLSATPDSPEDLVFPLQKPAEDADLAALLHALETTTGHIGTITDDLSPNNGHVMSSEDICAVLEAMEKNKEHCFSSVTTFAFRHVVFDTMGFLKRGASGMFPKVRKLEFCLPDKSEEKVQKLFRTYSESAYYFKKFVSDFRYMDVRQSSELDSSRHNEEKRAIISSLHHFPEMRSVTLKLRLNCVDTLSLSGQLHLLPNLSELNLEDNNFIKDEGAKALFEQLCQTPRLEVLRFAGNRFGSEAAESLAKNMSSLGALKVLDLSNCYIPFDGTVSVVENILHLTNLTDLRLQGELDEHISDLLADQLAHFPRLKVFHLENCDRIFSATINLAGEVWKTLTNLEHLDLHNAELDLECATAFADNLRLLQCLKEISLFCCSMSDEGVLAIVNACGDLPHLTTLGLEAVLVDCPTKTALLKACSVGGSLSRLTHLFLDIGVSKIFGHPDPFLFDDVVPFVRSHPLLFAAGAGHLDDIRKLLAANSDVEEKEETSGETAIFFAARAGRDDAIQLLVLEACASLSVKNAANSAVVDVCAEGSTTRALLEEMVYLGADERPEGMTKSAAKRFKPLVLEN